MDQDSATTVETLTLEDFRQLPEEDEFQAELVRGRIVREPAPGARHCEVAGRVYSALDAFARRTGTGKAAMEAGCVLELDPPTMRRPDVVFIPADRVPPGGTPRGWWEATPDIVGEVLSPTNRMPKILEKVADYLRCGSRLVWVLDLDAESVTIYRPEGRVRTVHVGDVLEGEDVLPGFEIDLAEIFAP